MGCLFSKRNQVIPLRPKKEQARTGSKSSGRGDSAVSKGTTDSGVVVENTKLPLSPGERPPNPPLVFECITESQVAHGPGCLQQVSNIQERPKSSEILDELLNQGIITECQSRGDGQAFNIMLDDGEVIRRRPPARLESLKAQKGQNRPSLEDLEEKMRLAEERRKLKDDNLKTRLRTKSACNKRPVLASTSENEDATHTECLMSPVNPAQTPLCETVVQEAGEGAQSETGDGIYEGGMSRVSRRNEEEEMSEREEVLTFSGKHESDLSFQQEEDKKEIF